MNLIMEKMYFLRFSGAYARVRTEHFIYPACTGFSCSDANIIYLELRHKISSAL